MAAPDGAKPTRLFWKDGDDDDDEPFIEVENVDVYYVGGIMTEPNEMNDDGTIKSVGQGLRLLLGDNWVTIGNQNTSGDYWNKRPVVKSTEWRNELLTAFMLEVNRIIDLVQAILAIFHITVNLPKIPTGLIKFLPTILTALEFALS